MKTSKEKGCLLAFAILSTAAIWLFASLISGVWAAPGQQGSLPTNTPTPGANPTPTPTPGAVPLSTGWNLIGLPLDPATAYTAETLGDEVNAQGANCTQVDRWYNSAWESHVNGLPFNDFSILLGEGYFLKCPGGGTWILQGQPITTPMTLSLLTGWNLVSVLYASPPLTAESLLTGINDQGGQCGEADRWENSGWESHPVHLPFNVFPIETGRGYFLKCTANSTYTPTGAAATFLAPTRAITAPGPAIYHVRVTNVRDTTFTVSWVTGGPADGRVLYGPTAPPGQAATDDRAADDTHHVVVKGLLLKTTYYFDVVSGGTTGDNGGAHYTVTTGPLLVSPPPSDVAYGQVFQADGITPAEGAIVYVTVVDKDGEGSAGESATLSALVDGDGYWNVNLGNARTVDLNGGFVYSASGDDLLLEVQGTTDGIAGGSIDTGEDSPAPTLFLGWPFQLYLPVIMRW